MKRGVRLLLLVVAGFLICWQHHRATVQWAQSVSRATQGSDHEGASGAHYDGAAVVSTQLLRLIQARMHWHAAGGGRFATPPMPVYATPAQLVLAHPRTSVWVMSAFLGTPRFASAAFGNLGAWRSVVDLLELKAQLPSLPIVDARPLGPGQPRAGADMQAVCWSAPEVAAGRQGGKSGQGPAGDGAECCSGGDCGGCGAGPAPQRHGWWRRQWRRTRGLLAPRWGSGGAWRAGASRAGRLAPAPVANCTVWASDGARVASFAVRAEQPPQPLRAPAQRSWKSGLAAARARAGAWLLWLLWPRWRLVRLLPMLQPELGWVALSAVVAGVKAQFSELCFLAASLPPILAARGIRNAAQTLAYFCVGITVLLVWEAHQQVAAELLFTWPLLRWLKDAGLANMWLASWHSARAWYVLAACLLPDTLQARVMQPLSWIWWIRQLALRLQAAGGAQGAGAVADAAGARRAETARAQAQRYQELRDYYEHAAARALSEAGLPVSRLRLPSEQRWPTALQVPECIDELDGDLVPRGFICPITQMVMRQPAMLISADIETPATYERQAIQDWLRSNRVDPRSRTRVGDDGRLVPNLELHRAIEDFCAIHAQRQQQQHLNLHGAGQQGAGPLLAGLSRLGSLGPGLGGLEQLVEAVSAAGALGGGSGGAAPGSDGDGGGGAPGSFGGACPSAFARQPDEAVRQRRRPSASQQLQQFAGGGGGMPFMSLVRDHLLGHGQQQQQAGEQQEANGQGEQQLEDANGDPFVFQSMGRRRLTARRVAAAREAPLREEDEEGEEGTEEKEDWDGPEEGVRRGGPPGPDEGAAAAARRGGDQGGGASGGRGGLPPEGERRYNLRTRSGRSRAADA